MLRLRHESWCACYNNLSSPPAVGLTTALFLKVAFAVLAGLESTVISGSERPKFYTFGETETIGLTVGQAEELKLRPQI